MLKSSIIGAVSTNVSVHTYAHSSIVPLGAKYLLGARSGKFMLGNAIDALTTGNVVQIIYALCVVKGFTGQSRIGPLIFLILTRKRLSCHNNLKISTTPCHT